MSDAIGVANAQRSDTGGTRRETLQTRLGPVHYVDTGAGRPLVFVAGASANSDLWAGVISDLDDSYRCVAIDLPLGAHHSPLLAHADRSATSLARLILDVIVALDLSDVVVVANDTAGGLCLLALAEQHPGLDRLGALVLTNCESFEHFPPRALRPLCALCRWTPPLARALLRASLRSERGRRRFARSVVARPLDRALADSCFDPLRNRRVADDLVRALAGFRPGILLAATPVLERFDHPVLLAWGDQCAFFPIAHAERLAATLPNATLTPIPDAHTWVPVDEPAQLANAIRNFLEQKASTDD